MHFVEQEFCFCKKNEEAAIFGVFGITIGPTDIGLYPRIADWTVLRQVIGE